MTDTARRIGVAAESAIDARPLAAISGVRPEAERAAPDAPQHDAKTHSGPHAAGARGSSGGTGSAVVHFGARAPAPASAPADYAHLKPSAAPAARPSAAPNALSPQLAGQAEASLAAEPSGAAAGAAAPRSASTPAAPASSPLGGATGDIPVSASIVLAASTAPAPVALDTKPHLAPSHSHRLPERIGETVMRAEVPTAGPSHSRALLIALVVLLVLVYIW